MMIESITDSDVVDESPRVELATGEGGVVRRGGQLRDAFTARLVQSVRLLESGIPLLESGSKAFHYLQALGYQV